ncbi:aldo/keto reductase [Opitutaceae bacterium EW11]|nr:aldo/keto reductase [Opitutaceae bacterium EW11]
MRRHRFGKTGLSVTELGFGGAPIGTLQTAEQDVGAVVNALLDAGVDVIDTAAIYGGSEEAIGRTVAHRRSEFVLISKCGQAFPDLPGEAWSAQLISATIDRALKRLRTDYLDVMLLHSCDLDVLRRGDALGAVAKARQSGKVRFVGYSGDNEAAAYAVTLPEVAVLETSVNLCDQANIDRVLPLAREHDVGVIAKRPLANTAWRNPQELFGFYQEYARPYHERFLAMQLTAESLGFTDADWPEIALRFTLSQPDVSTAIIGTTKRANAGRNLELVRKGPLAPAVVKQIREAFAAAEKRSGRSWPGLT